MPFKSKAQRRKFAQLLVEGKITEDQYEDWNRSTGRKVLPERIHPKTKAKRSTGKARTRRSPRRTARSSSRR